jgi:hypothetical protein|tara:strand:- start:99 stop:662 length:564 start_codon:yes stop_codon:yes gene_type:complete
MNLYAYIASNNPRKANMLLRNNGFGEGKSTTEIERRLKQYVREEKDEALKEMAKIHPDKELLVGDGVNRQLLNATGAQPQGRSGYFGEEFLQDLDTTSYYGHNAAQNRFRPIAPDFFNNAIGASQEQYPLNKSVSMEDVKKMMTEMNGNGNGNGTQKAGVLELSQQDIIMVIGFAFLGYMIAKKGKL